MPGLFDSLTMAARSLQSQQFAMNVTGQNISNVNTPGYTRRVVDFAAVPPPSGGGVEIQDVRRVRDSLLDGRLLQQIPLGSYDTAVADSLSVVETNLGKVGESLDQRLDAFFNAFADLAENPTSAVARRQRRFPRGDVRACAGRSRASRASGGRQRRGRPHRRARS